MLHVAFCSWLTWFSSHCYVNAGIWLALITWQNDWYKQGRHITFKCEGVKVFIKRPVAKISHTILWHNPFFPWKIWLQSPITLLNVERVQFVWNCSVGRLVHLADLKLKKSTLKLREGGLCHDFCGWL